MRVFSPSVYRGPIGLSYMRLASFFLLSVAAHAALLTLPVSFMEMREERAISVVLLGGTGIGGAGLDQGAGGKSGERAKGALAVRQHYPSSRKAEEQSLSVISGPEEMPGEKDQAPQIIPVSFDSGVVVAGVQGKQGGQDGFPLGTVESGVGGGSGGNGNSVAAGSGSGGSGAGVGLGGSGFGIARYAYNPKPKYPEAARREGWQGTVLLRVLVDQDGKSKSIKVGRTSGFETLDRAAVETVKSWRFHPAHYGDRRVESWVRIPIVFSLAELRD